MKYSQVQSVAGAVFSSDRKSILLIQRRDVPVWVLPGGGLEPDELPEQAIEREILEETGFTVKTVRLAGIYVPINRLSKFTHLYECEIVAGEASISNETKGVRFFPLAKLPNKIPPPYREWIADSLISAPLKPKKLTSVTYFALLKNFLLHPILVFRFLLARLGFPINT